ncbi:MAG: flagellar hook-basal body complex protein FliE [Myxococcales bacterium]|nr:flagellar hook-basal body complex protein FliE [Myxococcales bacterium]
MAPLGLPPALLTQQTPIQSRPEIAKPALAERPLQLGDESAVEGARSFADHLQQMVKEVDAQHKTADARTAEFAEGKSHDIHGTMIAMEQADISLRTLSSVRNRLIDAYREVMRMGA